MPERAHEHVLAAEPEAGLERRRLARLVVLVDVVEREPVRLEDACMLGEELVEIEGVVEAVGVDEVDRAVGLLEPVEVPEADQVVVRARIEVDAVGVPEPQLAQHLDLGALPGAEAQDQRVPRHDPDQVAEAAVEARPRLGHGRVRESVPDPQDLVELLPLVLDVLVVRVVLTVDEPLGVGREQALGVVVLRAHGMLVPLVHVAGIRLAPQLPVVAEAARRPPVERLPEPKRRDPPREAACPNRPVHEALHGSDDTVSRDEAERRRRHLRVA
jgi:hypothetical protein